MLNKINDGEKYQDYRSTNREREVNFMVHGGLPTHSLFSGEMQVKGFGKWDAPKNEFLINEMTSHFLKGIRVAVHILINFHHFVVVAASKNMRFVLDTLQIRK